MRIAKYVQMVLYFVVLLALSLPCDREGLAEGTSGFSLLFTGFRVQDGRWILLAALSVIPVAGFLLLVLSRRFWLRAVGSLLFPIAGLFFFWMLSSGQSAALGLYLIGMGYLCLLFAAVLSLITYWTDSTRLGRETEDAVLSLKKSGK